MLAPAFARVWFVVHDDFCAQWAEGCAIEVKGTMELCIGEKCGVDARRSKHIECHASL